jgi:FKBP-type peptidyl-prolyl cis-trans isomerase
MIMKNLLYLILSMTLVFGIFSCGGDVMEDNLKDIEEYLTDNNLTAQSTSSGLHYIIDNPGSSDHPTLQNVVTVHYHGYLSNGDVFDSSIDRGTPAEFPLTGVIQGWREGIPLFGKGGSGQLFIPSHLAYGENPPNGSSIPKNAVLIFDVELIDFR